MISVVIISKDEVGLDETLADVTEQAGGLSAPCEIVVVDASSGRLDDIWHRHKSAVRWVQFEPLPGVVTIPHQRNAGVREALGDIIVFTDAGCRLQAGWLERLVGPLRDSASITAGVTLPLSGERWYEPLSAHGGEAAEYLHEAATNNLAFRREAFDAVNGFDETFVYGSDMDFTWRLNDAGYKIQRVPDAIILSDYGTRKRQLRRSYLYGKARARLYGKHKDRRKHILRDDPIAVIYPLFLIGLPLTLVFPVYPLLLLIPAWRNRSLGAYHVLADHLYFGAGVLAELLGR
jgi:GT2 family glycosyltransferase